jgi:hypothetical protein
MRAARDDLERRVHDLKLTRQVTMQSLPSIRLVQENDKSLVTKINSTLVNTVPLWETQLAQAVTIQRATQAARAVREALEHRLDLVARQRWAQAGLERRVEVRTHQDALLRPRAARGVHLDGRRHYGRSFWARSTTRHE